MLTSTAQQHESDAPPALCTLKVSYKSLCYRKGFIVFLSFFFLLSSVSYRNLLKVSTGLGQYSHKRLRDAEVELSTFFSAGRFYLPSKPLFISTEHLLQTVCLAGERLEERWNSCWYILELCSWQLVPAYRDSGSTSLSTSVNLLVSPTNLMNATNTVLRGT